MTNKEDSHEAHDHDHDHDLHDHVHPHNSDHDHAHDHPHPHDHDPDHPHDHDHHHGKGVFGWIATIFHWHGHDQSHGTLANDKAFFQNELGIRTVWWALLALTITAVIQIIIVILSGSVALLADTIHNVGDGLNSIPLLIAFYLARRVATRRYNYGYSRAEDVAGIFIVLSIAFSAGVIFWESLQKFLNPEPMQNLGWVAVAAIVGFIGNEAVAILQIRVGNKIGSAAMVADGLHARTDGLTSLAVLLAAGGSWIGVPILDPIIGIMIGVAILFITRDATRTMWYRLMDAIEPDLLDVGETAVSNSHGVQSLRQLRMRWMGHQLHAEVTIAVEPELTTLESHHIAEHVRHDLFHALPQLEDIIVHVDPWLPEADGAHTLTTHHQPAPQPLS
ncbi:MAG: cation transporter [Chloroflexi bacterium]|nr:cation transporter [Chloroflexota bacterium]